MTSVKSKRSAGSSAAVKKRLISKPSKKLTAGKPVSDKKVKKTPKSKADPEDKTLDNFQVTLDKTLEKSQVILKKMRAAENLESPPKKTKRGKGNKTGETLVKSAKSPKKIGNKQIFNKAGKVGASAANQSLKRQRDRAAKLNRGVVYFSHLPHGFYEDELKGYCSQFGRVTGVYVPRSRAGNSKGYAFVEFKHPEVANVVAETMNNYLMFDRLVKAKIVPLEEQKPYIFDKSRNTNVVLAKKRKIIEAVKEKERILTPDEEAKRKRKAVAQVEKIHQQLKAKGLDYEFEVAY